VTVAKSGGQQSHFMILKFIFMEISRALRAFPCALLLTCILVCAAPITHAQARSGAETQASASLDTDAAANESPDPEATFPHFKNTRFWLSGQMNFIFQTHSDFPADYSGKNSLSPN
jgi:hypothetical protein